jgi:hypothetical protein
MRAVSYESHTSCRVRHRAARPGGSLVLIEYTLPPVPEPANGHLQDILMMVLFGGRERTYKNTGSPRRPTSPAEPVGGIHEHWPFLFCTS